MVQTIPRGLDDHLDEICASVRSLKLYKATGVLVTPGNAQYFASMLESTSSSIEDLQRQLLSEVRHQSKDSSACLSSDDLILTDAITLSALEDCTDLLIDLLCWLYAHREQRRDQLRVEGTVLLPQATQGSECEIRNTAKRDTSESLLLGSCADGQVATSEGVSMVQNISVGSGGC